MVLVEAQQEGLGCDPDAANLRKHNPLSFPLLHNPQPHTPISPPPGRSHRLTESPLAAALLAPKGREQDWIFSTESGHLQILLLSPGVARLMLIGDSPTTFSDSSSLAYRKREDATYVKSLEKSLKPHFFALFPTACAKDGIFYVPILDYEHNMISSVVLEREM
ncbi:hypothetical protein DKX38_012168 [Salix brachista]|uniref:Uncharacterized protein n=1 Tax=Salix brachista TaxID=2182728 RepID=A0A5N5LQ25_9ROSI|nr:hypothetical protein DKX38_012168 [Salix brachista]